MEKKTKKYFTTIPLQYSKEDLKKVIYDSIDNPALEYGETRFPIIPVIANTVNADDTIEVAVILTCDNGIKKSEIEKNYQFFKDELEELKKSNVFKDYRITEILTEDNERIETQIKLLKDMMAEIGDNQQLYSCTTYGTKPTPVVMMLALNYGYKIKNNTTVENVVYGRYINGSKTNIGSLYDITALFYANSYINRIADSKITNPDDALDKFLQF